MKKARWVTAAAGTAVLAAGFVLPGATAAYADTNPGGSGNGGLLSVLGGNTVNAPVSLPVNVCGVALGLLGGSSSDCGGGSSSTTTINGSGPAGGDNGNGGGASVGSGNTVNAPVSVPVNVCGVSAAVGGVAGSRCKGGTTSHTSINGSGSGGDNGNAGILSALSGNTVNAPVSVPVDVCGIAVAIIGESSAGCIGGSASDTTIGGTEGHGGDNGNAGILSALSGNTVNAPVSVPVNVCGVSVAVIGAASSACQGGATSITTVGTPGSGGHHHGHYPPGNPGGINPGGINHPGGGSHNPPGGGVQSGAGVTTTVAAESLPITGANIAGMLIAALGSLGLGGASLVMARRRRQSGETA